MEKIREKPEPNPKLDENKSTYERHRQVKLVLLIFFLLPININNCVFFLSFSFCFQRYMFRWDLSLFSIINSKPSNFILYISFLFFFSWDILLDILLLLFLFSIFYYNFFLFNVLIIFLLDEFLMFVFNIHWKFCDNPFLLIHASFGLVFLIFVGFITTIWPKHSLNFLRCIIHLVGGALRLDSSGSVSHRYHQHFSFIGVICRNPWRSIYKING